MNPVFNVDNMTHDTYVYACLSNYKPNRFHQFLSLSANRQPTIHRVVYCLSLKSTHRQKTTLMMSSTIISEIIGGNNLFSIFIIFSTII